jgi:hypothetical protein
VTRQPDIRLVVDGVDLTGEYKDFETATPRARYLVPDEARAASWVLGPAGFTILIVEPSDRLYALVDGGRAVRDTKVIVNGHSITHPTHFHKGWVGADGVRKMFGSLAPDREREAKWVEELPAGASTTKAEGN